MRIVRPKYDKIADVTVDNSTKKVKISIPMRECEVDQPQLYDPHVYLKLSKREVTQLIRALKSQRDRKYVR